MEELSKEHKRLTEPIGRYGRMWDFFTPPKTDELTLKKGLFQYMEYVHLPSVHFVLGACFDIHPTKGNLLSNFLRPSKGILFKNYVQRALQQFHFLMHNMRGQPACECKPSTKSVPGLEHLRFMGLAIYLKMDPLGLQIFYVRFHGVVSSKERPLVTTLGLSHHVD